MISSAVGGRHLQTRKKSELIHFRECALVHDAAFWSQLRITAAVKAMISSVISTRQLQ
jgi:hypothetical protein